MPAVAPVDRPPPDAPVVLVADVGALEAVLVADEDWEEELDEGRVVCPADAVVASSDGTGPLKNSLVVGELQATLPLEFAPQHCHSSRALLYLTSGNG